MNSMEETEGTYVSPHLGAGPGLIKVKGMWYPKVYLKFEPDKIEKIENFEARSDDIWLCSYPKSGTSWLQQVVYLLMREQLESDRDHENADERFPYLEGIVPVTNKLNIMQGQRLIKSHLCLALLPKSIFANKSKVIYVARNVKDVSVSMYHFHQLLTNVDYKGSFKDFYEEFIEGKVCYDKWWNHVLEFWKIKDLDHVLFIKYEDMQKNAVEEIRKLAEFLGLNRDSKFIQEVAEATTFSKMKDDPNSNQSWQVDKGIYKNEPDKKFMRKGKVGDWKNYYSDAQSEEIDKICSGTIKPHGLTFDYE